MESRVYNEKRRCAEAQMEAAKDACEKIKRKRSSLVGAFVSTHGRSIDDVDKSILGAKTALLELTQDLTERSRRWRQIEMLTGVNIVTNPGLPTLQKIGKWDSISCVVAPRGPSRASQGTPSPRWSRSHLLSRQSTLSAAGCIAITVVKSESLFC
jgi:hypothetical protein